MIICHGFFPRQYLKNLFNFSLKSRKRLFCVSLCVFCNRKRTYFHPNNRSKNAHYCSQSVEPPWRILFFGSDNFSIKSLEILCSKLRTGTLIRTLDVCTTSGQRWNKKYNPVYEFAKSEKLKLLIWPDNLNDIKNKYDIGLVVSFGFLIPEYIIHSLPLGVLNVHASLLPRWRGAAPVIRAVMNGDTETGISIMKINPHKFDTGDVVRQYTITIQPRETAKDLTSRLADVGARLLMECIRDLPRCLEHTTPQSKDNVCYAKKVTASTAKINWNTKSAEEIYNQSRALSHLFPLTTYWFDFLIKIPSLHLDEITGMNPENKKNIQKLQTKEEIIPGLIEYSSRRSLLRVQCKDGKWVCFNSIVVSGWKRLTPLEFYRYFACKIKNSLERKFIVK